MKVFPRGNFNSPIWCVLYEPTKEDVNTNIALSGSIGYGWDSLVKDAGLPDDIFIKVMREGLTHADLQQEDRFWLDNLISVIKVSKPSIIIAYGAEITQLLVPDTRSKKKPFKCQLEKYAGSILQSPWLDYPHYIIPVQPMEFIWANYDYKTIAQNLDLGHVKEEYEYFKLNNKLNPLPQYEFILEPHPLVLLEYLSSIRNSTYLSADIETIGHKKSRDHNQVRAGYPYTLGLADSSTRGCSFSFWDYELDYLVKIWRELEFLFKNVPQIGQNYFTFDAHFLEALGFTLCLERCQDTLIRHHILYPELPHKLQFQTKQYTRQSYYKDEGKSWTPKRKKDLMRYNALDVVCTYEIFNKQEEDFNDRPHLR